jgi:lipopolysaccharide export system permease protein
MKIQRYFAREILLAFAVSFLLFFFVFFLNQILLLAEEILKKRAPVDQVLILIAASLPSILALTAPFASLLGILLAVGRLAGDKEVLAAQASGIPHRVLFLPVVVLGLVFTLGSYIANDVLLPQGAVTFNRVYRQLILSTPELELGSYSVKFYKNFFIVTGKVDGRVVHGVSLLDKTGREDQQLITAKTARLMDNPTLPGVLTLRFEDVIGIVPDARRPGSYESYTARQLDYNIVLRDLVPSSPTVGPKEMRSVDLARQIQAKQDEVDRAQASLRQTIAQAEGELKTLWWLEGTTRPERAARARELTARIRDLRSRDLTDRVLAAWKTEYYQKFAIPLACLCFVFLAYPLGVILQRRGLTGIIGLGLLTAVLYWASLLLARTLALEWGWWPEAALFLPNLLILAAGIPLLMRLRR